MKIGVVGCGYWGEKHVRVLSSLPSVDQVVLIDPDDRVREKLQRQYPGCVGVSSLAEGLDLIDGAVVATPAHTHFPLGNNLLTAGKHVLIEKPMATTTADALALGRLADERGLTLMVGHTFEFNESVVALSEIIAGGQLGEVRTLTSSRLNLGRYQPDVNVVWDLAPHDISIMNFLLDATPVAVNCWGWRNMSPDVEDVAFVDLQYSDGRNALVHVSWLHPIKERQITAVGDKAMAVYDDIQPGHPIRIHDKGASHGGGHAGDMRYWDGDVRMPVVSGREALLNEDEHFVSCIADGAEPRSGHRSGVAVTAALEAASISLREGRNVELAPLLAGQSPVVNGYALAGKRSA